MRPPIRRLYEPEAPPVCVGVLLGYDGHGESKWPSLNTAETAVPPFFCSAKSNFKVTMV